MVCEKEKCTGCFACYNICPKNAIEMCEDELGYIYPSINNDKCIHCNLCKKVCPALNNLQKNKSKQAFAMWNNNKKFRQQSTSGGIASTLYEYILKNGGIIYGCTNSVEDKFKFIRVDNINDLYLVRGSKYVHSYVNDCFKQVKNDLNDGKKVMFIGMPCQVAGLKNFLGKEYKNLYLADLICHGVPSQKLLREEAINKLGDIKNIKVTFRENGEFCIKFYLKNKEMLNEKQDRSFYFLGFMKALFYRENCYTCEYANINRVGDITLGDFWGLGKDDKINKYKKEEKNGISLCLVNTDKGRMMLDTIKEECYFEERKIEEAISGNSQLRNPSVKNKQYEKFRKLYSKYGYRKASQKCLKKDKLKQKLKKFIRK